MSEETKENGNGKDKSSGVVVQGVPVVQLIQLKNGGLTVQGLPDVMNDPLVFMHTIRDMCEIMEIHFRKSQPQSRIIDPNKVIRRPV